MFTPGRWGTWPISAIRPSALQAWVTGLPLAPSTAKVVLNYVGGIFRAAVRDRVIAVNPTEGVRPPAARKAEVYIPGLAVVQGVRAALPPRYRGVIDVVLGAGLRQGEVFGLDVAAVDFLRCRALTVRQQLVSLSPEPLYLGPPKTAESERTIPLAQRTLDALAAHLAEHPAFSLEIEDRTDPQRPRRRGADLVFTTDAGSPISRSMRSQIWRPGRPRCGAARAGRTARAEALLRLGADRDMASR